MTRLPGRGSPTQLGCGPLSRRHYIEEVGAAEAGTPRKNSAHLPTSTTLPTEGVPEATGSLPPPSSLHFTGGRHCTILQRRTPSTPMRCHPLLPEPHGQFLLSLPLESLSLSVNPQELHDLITIKEKIPTDLLLDG